MMSPGIGRLPGFRPRCGHAVKYMSPTDDFLKYQIGMKYRIPLWGRFHDCVVFNMVLGRFVKPHPRGMVAQRLAEYPLW